MKARWYAEALLRALEGKSKKEEERIVANFYRVVRARGHEKLLPRIPRELEASLSQKAKDETVTLVTADVKSFSKWSHACDHYEHEGILPSGQTPKHIVDKGIIGGYQIRSNRLLIDASYKRSLLNLYRTITK